MATSGRRRGNADDRLLINTTVEEEEIEIGGRGCCAEVLCNPSHRCNRFLALIFMCLMGFGSYFCYDNPAALQDNLKEDLKLSTYQFVLFYSVYSWPNVILCFIGGFLIDRVFGIRLGSIIYMVILLNGVTLFALGAYMNLFWLMIVGRFVFGIGGEALSVAQNSYAVRWFKGKELNMVFGLQLSFARVGSTVNFLVMEPLYKWVSDYYTGPERIGVVLFIASLACVLSFICVLVLGWMDRKADNLLSSGGDNNQEEPVKLSDIRYLKGTFWMVSVICVTYYLAVFPFIALGKVFFERRFDLSPESANQVNSLLYILSAVISPAMGLLIDKIGRNLYWVIISILSTIGAHAILTFTFWNPYVGMVLFGLSYSALASALWPLVALIVPENQLGTAYGICQAVQNLGLAGTSLLTGIIVDNGGYFMLELFFMGCLFVALIAAICVYIMDTASTGVLNMSPKQRAEMERSTVQEDRVQILPENEENEEFLPNQAFSSSINDSDRIRTRYLRKIGTQTSLENVR